MRAALSETHVVQQTKRLLEEEGVNLDALERAARGDAAAAAAPRSNRVILAKNLPFAVRVRRIVRACVRARVLCVVCVCVQVGVSE